MKKILVILICTLVGLQSHAQDDDEILYGDVRYDGFANITQKAMWSKRPEAKMVYEGGFPLGVEVYELTEDYFVRFAGKEHNALDRNYIIVPKGEKVYKKDGNYYLAICGNRLEYLRPVNQITIIRVPVKSPPRLDIVYLPAPEKKEEQAERIPDHAIVYELPRQESQATPSYSNWKTTQQPSEQTVGNTKVKTTVITPSLTVVGDVLGALFGRGRQVDPRQQNYVSQGYMGGGRGDGWTNNNGNEGSGRGN